MGYRKGPLHSHGHPDCQLAAEQQPADCAAWTIDQRLREVVHPENQEERTAYTDDDALNCHDKPPECNVIALLRATSMVFAASWIYAGQDGRTVSFCQHVFSSIDAYSGNVVPTCTM